MRRMRRQVVELEPRQVAAAAAHTVGNAAAVAAAQSILFRLSYRAVGGSTPLQRPLAVDCILRLFPILLLQVYRIGTAG